VKVLLVKVGQDGAEESNRIFYGVEASSVLRSNNGFGGRKVGRGDCLIGTSPPSL
jgi:hypothetical protein